MEVIKRKILLENSTDRTDNSPTWGVMTASTFYIKVMITQNMDDMGLFTDAVYIPKGNSIDSVPDYSVLIEKLNFSGITFPFMLNIQPATVSSYTETDKVTLRFPFSNPSTYYDFGNSPITGATDSKIDDVKSYDATTPYKVAFDIGTETYTNYNNVLINGVNRIKSMGNPRIYVFDTPNNASLGTNTQIYGLQYLDYSGITRQVVIDGLASTIPLTTFRYIGEGWNETNVSLSALTKEEYLFGIISPPEVQSDVFIDRGVTTVMDMHLKMSEIKNLGELSRYGNGYYNLTTE